jgi:hypothetical protein
MTNPSKAKGTTAEGQVAAYLRDFAWPMAERRTLAGSSDRGDIAGVPDVCLEVKACKAFDLAGWSAELVAEMRNANARHGAVIAKRRGTLDVGRWYAIAPVSVYLDTLREALR